MAVRARRHMRALGWWQHKGQRELVSAPADSGWRAADPISARAGIGLRSAHQDEVIRCLPPLRWIEVHGENYFAAGGAQLDALHSLRQDYPLSLHGVGLSLGSADALDVKHLQAIKDLIERFEPGLVSEHLSWSSIDGQHLNDLLPLPYTEEAVRHLAEKISRCQDYLGRQIIVENVSSYLEFSDSEMLESEFVIQVAAAADCGILLDVNNVYVNACNHGFDAFEYIDAMPAARVQEFHLAGHQANRCDEYEVLIDTHDAPVADEVWRLFAYTVERIGLRPSLIEWDAHIPELAVLIGEAAKAEAILDNYR
jgi:uncharacterized protein (UPF0276 family)